MKITTKKWDASEYLDNPEIIQEYLMAALEDGGTELLISAIGDVAKAKGMTEMAKATHLNRQHLYRALSSNGSPKFDTIVKVLEALDCELSIVKKAG